MNFEEQPGNQGLDPLISSDGAVLQTAGPVSDACSQDSVHSCESLLITLRCPFALSCICCHPLELSYICVGEC